MCLGSLLTVQRHFNFLSITTLLIKPKLLFLFVSSNLSKHARVDLQWLRSWWEWLWKNQVWAQTRSNLWNREKIIIFYNGSNRDNLHLDCGWLCSACITRTRDFSENFFFFYIKWDEAGCARICPASCRRQNLLHSFRQAGYMSPSWMNNLILKVYFKAAHQVVSLPTAASQPSRQSKIERNDFLQMFDKTVSGW